MVLLILRKRRLAALALAVLTVGIGLLWLPQRQAAAALSAVQARPVVVLDAGHGGADGGAVSDSGVAESGINLAITQRLAEVLCFFGQPVVLTRTGTDALCGPEDVTLRQQKVSDTKNRVALVNSHSGARLISIHQNCLPGYPSVRGAQAFCNGVDGGQAMADCIQQALNSGVNVSGKESKRISDSIYLMKHASCPAALVECGFLSNREETELLQQPEYQIRIAAAIAAGYLQYCTNEGSL